MSEPEDMILPLLREMRADIAAGRAENTNHFEIMDRRLRSLEETQRSFKQALSADSLLSKLVTGEFEALERKVRELESHQ